METISQWAFILGTLRYFHLRKDVVELKQIFTVVLDPIRTNQAKSWPLESLFGSNIPTLCPFASETVLFLDIVDKTPNVRTLPNLTNGKYLINPGQKNAGLEVNWFDQTVNNC